MENQTWAFATKTSKDTSLWEHGKKSLILFLLRRAENLTGPDGIMGRDVAGQA